MAATVKIERYNFDEEIAKIYSKLQALQESTALSLSQKEIDNYKVLPNVQTNFTKN